MAATLWFLFLFFAWDINCDVLIGCSWSQNISFSSSNGWISQFCVSFSLPSSHTNMLYHSHTPFFLVAVILWFGWLALFATQHSSMASKSEIHLFKQLAFEGSGISLSLPPAHSSMLHNSVKHLFLVVVFSGLGCLFLFAKKHPGMVYDFEIYIFKELHFCGLGVSPSLPPNTLAWCKI